MRHTRLISPFRVAPNVTDRPFTQPLFHAHLARKDVRHATSLARESGTRLPALEIVDANLAKVEKLKQEKGDYVGLYSVLRQEAGMAYEN
jgi:3-hydroxyisobutyrate dehydrogenase-like beta-hydroxyacid dehydrogenase